MSFLAHLFNS